MQLLIQYIVILHLCHALLSIEAIRVCNVGIYAVEEGKGWFMAALKGTKTTQ